VTEQEWLDCTNPEAMLDFVHGKASDRQLRLLAACSYRLIAHWVRDSTSRAAVEVAERFADRLADRGQLARAYGAGYTTYLNSYDNSIFAYAVADADAAHSARIAARDVAAVQGAGGLATLVRDIIVNPFRPWPPVEPSVLAWNNGIVKRLAEQVYGDRSLPVGTLDPARLAVLADALEDAGGTDGELLRHLRGPGPHVRGCWAVDALLGRE
jgi:hypothetical protein